MPARGGRQYIEGLREQRREVWLRGRGNSLHAV